MNARAKASEYLQGQKPCVSCALMSELKLQPPGVDLEDAFSGCPSRAVGLLP